MEIKKFTSIKQNNSVEEISEKMIKSWTLEWEYYQYNIKEEWKTMNFQIEYNWELKKYFIYWFSNENSFTKLSELKKFIKKELLILWFKEKKSIDIDIEIDNIKSDTFEINNDDFN